MKSVTKHVQRATIGVVLMLATVGCSASIENETAGSTETVETQENEVTVTTSDGATDVGEETNESPDGEEVVAGGNRATVPGYESGTFPDVPPIVLPDLSMRDESANSATVSIADQIAGHPGVEVTSGHCDESGRLISGEGSVVLVSGTGPASVGNGNVSVETDGGAVNINEDGDVDVSGGGADVDVAGENGGEVNVSGGGADVNVTGGNGGGIDVSGGGGAVNIGGNNEQRQVSDNDGGGSGSFSINGVEAVVNGDGSGSYNDGIVEVVSNGDGSGRYESPSTSIIIHGDGSGSSEHNGGVITNNGDGSGSYEDSTVSITNNGDGSGSYEDPTVSITNNGDGTGYINGEEVTLAPLLPLPPTGDFPSMGALRPTETCGTTITLSDSVLFDFSSDQLRPEVNEVLYSLSSALNGIDVTEIQVRGHTGSVGSDSYNLDLSNRRAAEVATALETVGITAPISSQGFGETQPVAPNEVNGHDNPSGRQMNGRIELFIPS